MKVHALGQGERDGACYVLRPGKYYSFRGQTLGHWLHPMPDLCPYVEDDLREDMLRYGQVEL